MFIPNTSCVVRTASGQTDVYGMPIPGATYSERLSIITMTVENQKSAIRADSSATRGNAQELEAKSVFLMTKTTKANIDDIIELFAYQFRIMTIFPRLDLQGNLDHYEVGCTYWTGV